MDAHDNTPSYEHRYWELCWRISYLTGWYEATADRTGNADLAELVAELRAATNPDPS